MSSPSPEHDLTNDGTPIASAPVPGASRAGLAGAALVGCLVAVAAPGASALDALAYYPLNTGDSWTYSVSGFRPELGVVSYDETETVQSGTSLVNGVATKRLLTTSGPDAGDVSYETNGALGVQLHRALTPDVATPWGPRDLIVTYSPPATLANATSMLGEQLESSGTYALLVSGVATYNLSYELASRIADRMEWVTVPAGRFSTVRLDTTIEVQGSVAGQPVSVVATEQTWLASGIGRVQVSYSDREGASDSSQLTATNRVYTPEPSIARGGMASLSALLLLGCRRRPGTPLAADCARSSAWRTSRRSGAQSSPAGRASRAGGADSVPFWPSPVDRLVACVGTYTHRPRDFPVRPFLRRPPMRHARTLLLLCCFLAVAVSVPASADGPRPKPGPTSSDVYPTDRCVAQKLHAASLYCASTVRVSAQQTSGPKHGRGHQYGRGKAKKDRDLKDVRLKGPRKMLQQAWDRAEYAAEAAGVSCDETTVSAEEMIELLDDGAEALADELDGSGVCRQRRVAFTANTCRTLLAAESTHLLQRDRDRKRARLARTQEWAVDQFEKSWRRSCRWNDDPAPTDAVVGLAEEAFLATVVSPAVSQEWTMITPPDQVQYGDQVLEPICSRGTPWVYFAKRGTVNKLIVYYQGGGACWDLLTCGQVAPTFKQTAGPGDNPANASTGFADFSDPENPFRDWNAVFVPYCTGDVHWGDAVVQHLPDSDIATIHHKGRINAAVAEKFAREHFVNPDQVFVTGSSAGAYGAVVNGLFLQEDAYPSTPFAVLGDGGNGVITEEFLENDLAKWGIENNLPRWIPGLDKPLTELKASDLWTEAALYYPQSRFGNYSTAYDGGQGGQVGFYNIMLSGESILDWFLWWRPSCEWNQQMRMLVQDSATRAPDNYRYYIGVGSRHTMWGSDKVYTDTTGGVPTVVSWLNAMLDGTPAWTDVECTDCGQLLPGDPRPNPVQPPYVTDPATNQTSVVCE